MPTIVEYTNLTNFPNLEENEVFIELIFEEICDLAQAYSDFVIKTEAESSNQEECSLDQ